MGTVNIQLNYFGFSMKPEDIEGIFSGDGQPHELNRSMLDSFFGVPTKNLPRDYVERYVELSPPEMYQPVVPHDEKLLNRLFEPLKSAKRCYCLGEYLATIELCAHVGEMLAILAWNMTSIKYNGNPTDDKFEASVLSSKFEKLGQERRIKILEGFKLLSEAQKNEFMNLKNIRIKYFHLWSGDFSEMKSDSCRCFKIITDLIKDILQIGINNPEIPTLCVGTHRV